MLSKGDWFENRIEPDELLLPLDDLGATVYVCKGASWRQIVEVPIQDLCVAAVTMASEPVGVSIDILDEGHSLKLAMRRLATDGKLRTALGSNARALWAERFSMERMIAGYRRAIGIALDAGNAGSATEPSWPRHLRSTGAEHAEALVREILASEYHLRDAD